MRFNKKSSFIRNSESQKRKDFREIKIHYKSDKNYEI